LAEPRQILRFFAVPGGGIASGDSVAVSRRCGPDAAAYSHLQREKEYGVPISILEAVKMGQWDYEPPAIDDAKFSCTRALPGSDEKLAILAERLRQGLPLWHSKDCRNYADLAGERDD
jgi:hypothetical protein